MKKIVFFIAAIVMVVCVGPSIAQERKTTLPKIVTLEGKNFNRKDADGEIVTVGDDGWGKALYYHEKAKIPFTGSLIIPFFKNGTNNVQAIISFEKGKPHGEATVWHKNGRKNAEEDFDAGKLIKGSYWLENGKLDPKGNKDSSLGVSTKLLARLALQALANRGGFGLPPEKDPENIRFDNWLKYQANAEQKQRNQECVRILTGKFRKTGLSLNQALNRTYCWIRAPQHRHRFVAYIVTGIDPQGQGAGLTPQIITSHPGPKFKRPPLPDGMRGNGSGFFITTDGYLITNHHVAGKAKYLTVRGHLATGGRELRAKVVAVDTRNDLALLKVTGRFTALPIISSRLLVLGDNIFTIGYPRAGVQGVYPKLTKGGISSLAGIFDNPTRFQVSVPTQPGNSGGPHLNEFGNVIGVHVAGLKSSGKGKPPQLVNYAIKSDVLLAFLQRSGVRLNRPAPHFATTGGFRDVVRRTEPACIIVIVY